jgi:hypothetical protein
VPTGQSFRKAHIQAGIDRFEIDDGVVRITGDKAFPGTGHRAR